MYLIGNAMKNLLRNKGRNILIAAITLAIVVSVVITLTINNAAARIIDEIRLDLGSRVEVRQDLMDMREIGLGRDDVSYISIEDFYSFARSDYLRTTIFNADMYAWSDTFCAVMDDPAKPGQVERSDGKGGIVLDETCKLITTSEPAILPEFGAERAILPGGRMFEGINECIISEELALLNGIAVGDGIELRSAIATDKHYSLTVVGIYSDETEEYSNMMFMFNRPISENRRNEIITSFDTLMTAGWETNAGLDMKTYYFLNDPDNVRKYEDEVRSKGLPVTYNVAINQVAYDKVTGPLSGVRGATVTFMIVILILGAIVLAIISFMAVRERKYEVGVLRAMGMEKSKVAFGILAETMMVSVLCLAIGLGAGTAMAQPIADNMLAGRVTDAEAEAEVSGGGNKVLFAGGQMQTDDKAAGYVPESEINVSLSAAVILEIILITFALATLSGVICVVVITQYEPLKILRERS